MKKRICAILLTAIMLLPLLTGCGCGGNGNSGSNNGSATPKGESKTDVAALKTSMEDMKAGDIFSMGIWDQDGRGDWDPIELTVIRQDVGKALVVSTLCLARMPFYEQPKDDDSRWPSCIWPESTVRTWLEGEFYEKAFSDAEKALILPVTHTTTYYQNGVQTKDTEDRVFAPSADEVFRYMTQNGTTGYGQPTDRVAAEKPYMTEFSNGEGVDRAMGWWLRDSGEDSSKALSVPSYDKKPNTMGDDVTRVLGVRPAMWIAYNNDLMTKYEKGEAEPKEDPELNAKIAGWKVGDIVTFGEADLDPWAYNGYEGLTWIVLDERSDAFLLMLEVPSFRTKYMEESRSKDEEHPLTWAESELRATLNGKEFMDLIFRATEKAKILLTHLSTTGDDNWKRPGGDETDDYLFLPDLKDIEKYFPEKEDQVAGNAEYWLRSPSFVDPHMGYIYSSGGIGSKEATDYCGCRIMMWIRK